MDENLSVDFMANFAIHTRNAVKKELLRQLATEKGCENFDRENHRSGTTLHTSTEDPVNMPMNVDKDLCVLRPVQSRHAEENVEENIPKAARKPVNFLKT